MSLLCPPLCTAAVLGAAGAAVPEVWLGRHVVPVLCGVVCELNRVSTGQGTLWSAHGGVKGAVHFKSELSLPYHSWNNPEGVYLGKLFVRLSSWLLFKYNIRSSA